jgi:hypothetical protein
VTTIHINVELSVNTEADATELADWLFELLVDLPDLHPAIDSVDGTSPSRL